VVPRVKQIASSRDGSARLSSTIASPRRSSRKAPVETRAHRLLQRFPALIPESKHDDAVCPRRILADVGQVEAHQYPVFRRCRLQHRRNIFNIAAGWLTSGGVYL